MLQEADENDFILRIVARDWDAYFLTKELTALQNVAHVKTSPTIRCSKSKPGVPVNISGGRRGGVIAAIFVKHTEARRSAPISTTKQELLKRLLRDASRM